MKPFYKLRLFLAIIISLFSLSAKAEEPELYTLTIAQQNPKAQIQFFIDAENFIHKIEISSTLSKESIVFPQKIAGADFNFDINTIYWIKAFVTKLPGLYKASEDYLGWSTNVIELGPVLGFFLGSQFITNPDGDYGSLSTYLRDFYKKEKEHKLIIMSNGFTPILEELHFTLEKISWTRIDLMKYWFFEMVQGNVQSYILTRMLLPFYCSVISYIPPAIINGRRR
jgi:hypothetical protein